MGGEFGSCLTLCSVIGARHSRLQGLSGLHVRAKLKLVRKMLDAYLRHNSPSLCH